MTLWLPSPSLDVTTSHLYTKIYKQDNPTILQPGHSAHNKVYFSLPDIKFPFTNPQIQSLALYRVCLTQQFTFWISVKLLALLNWFIFCDVVILFVRFVWTAAVVCCDYICWAAIEKRHKESEIMGALQPATCCRPFLDFSTVPILWNIYSAVRFETRQMEGEALKRFCLDGCWKCYGLEGSYTIT